MSSATGMGAPRATIWGPPFEQIVGLGLAGYVLVWAWASPSRGAGLLIMALGAMATSSTVLVQFFVGSIGAGMVLVAGVVATRPGREGLI